MVVETIQDYLRLDPNDRYGLSQVLSEKDNRSLRNRLERRVDNKITTS